MKHCQICHERLQDGDGHESEGLTLCDECYLDRVWPKVRQAYYENDPAEFMKRLKRSYSVHPQKFH